MEQQFEVVSPIGVQTTEKKQVTRRLDDLNGKTVGEFWNGVFKGDQTFPAIRELLAARFPDIRIVPFSDFPFVHTGDDAEHQKKLADDLARSALAKGCDAIISGNGA